MALNSLFCADVPLSNYSLTHWAPGTVGARQSHIAGEFIGEVNTMSKQCHKQCRHIPPTGDRFMQCGLQMAWLFSVHKAYRFT